MAYTRRPFNPLTPYPNQVVSELEKANENFDLLAQVFLGNDPATKVLKSDVYTFRRVDLTNATSDYELKLGEEAFYVWDTTQSTSLPLLIRVSGYLYELIVLAPRTSFPLYLFLYPNNTSYSNAFSRTVIYPNGSGVEVYNWKDTGSAIFYEQVGGGGMLVSWLQTMTSNKGEMHHMTLQHTGPNFSLHMQVAHRWNDTSTVWYSLGTLVITDANGTLYVSVRRLV